MKTNDYLNAEISLFSRCFETEPVMGITVQDFISTIKSPPPETIEKVKEIRRLTALSKDKKDKHDLAAAKIKDTLPSVTLSGAIAGKSKQAMQEGRMAHSGLIQLDIDAKDNIGRDPFAVRDAIGKDEYVLAAFISPSGNGVKALVCVPQCATEEQHKQAWHSMSEYFRDTYDLAACTSTKNSGRMCFMSHDPDCVVNLSAKTLPITEKPKEKKAEAPQVKNGSKYTLADLAEMIAPIPRQEYGVWLELCSGAWNEFGEAATPILKAQWAEEKEGEYKEKYRHRLEEITLGTVIHHARKHGWSDRATAEDFDNEEMPDTKDTKRDKLRFECIHHDDLEDGESAFDFVENLLTDGAASVIYGASNTGKTFFAIDLGAHVATGREWMGKEVEQGAVIYIALEGEQGAKNRIRAMQLCGKLPKGAPFFLCFSPINLLDSDHPEAIKRMIKSVSTAAGLPVRFVIIDTMARAMAGGDENSGESMGLAVSTIDSVRKSTGAHVCIIHHSGKDVARGARGHSSLRAAIDTEIEVIHPEGDIYRTASVVKQRDLATIAPLVFSLEPVNVGINRRGKVESSCIVKAENSIMAHVKGKAGAKKQFTCEMILELLPQPTVKAWQIAAKDEHGMSKDTFGDRKRECASLWHCLGNQIVLKPLENKEKWDNGEIDF